MAVSTEHDPDRLVRDVMVARPKTMPATATVADVRQTFANSHVISALLVDGDAFAGVITRGAIADTVPDDASARDFADTAVPTIRPNTPVADAVAMLDADGERRLVVLADDGKTLAGLLCLDESRTGFCGTGSQHS